MPVAGSVGDRLLDDWDLGLAEAEESSGYRIDFEGLAFRAHQLLELAGRALRHAWRRRAGEHQQRQQEHTD